MEAIQIPQTLRKSMQFHSSYCEKHTYVSNGVEVSKPVQKMIINGNIICPRCECQKETLRLQKEQSDQYEESFNKRNYNVLSKQSILADNTILNASFKNYFTECEEEVRNKLTILDVIKRLKEGQVFNVILQGKQGTGKSHLAYATLRELNESTNSKCLFINIESMLRLIKDSFKNKESKYTENYFIDLLSSVEFLALDDIGAETGAIGTDKAATDFVQRILYAITTTRQDKATIITTNLSSKTLFNMYDSKLVSRLFKNPKYILFKDTKDKRMASIPF